tara:strand:+ start:812 stop:1384 length:573 start_codon:yes stop_codon:yes gene_type:complete
VALMSIPAFCGVAAAQSPDRMTLRESFERLRVAGDFNLRDQRTRCSAAMVRASNLDDPSPLEFCLVVMEETLSRDPGDQTYIMRLFTDWSIRYPQTILQEIARASMQDGQEFLSVNDMSGARVMKPLNCQTAFDAGFFFGTQNPTQDLDPNTDEATHRHNAEQCFDMESDSTRASFLAGMSFGRLASSRD